MIYLREKTNKLITYDNRGMSLENDLNITNSYYLNNNIACITKKPTPIQVVRVNYTSGKKAIIKEAFFKTPSTTDYNGIYKGKYIDFEAKETNLDYFPLNNIHEHQIKHLNTVYNMGGVSFIIIRFNKHNNTTFLLETWKLISFINNNIRKSIPYSYFLENGYEIDFKYGKRIDYLKVIDSIIEGERYE